MKIPFVSAYALICLISFSGINTPLLAQTSSFSIKTLSGFSLNNPTSLDFGPDGRLYASTQDGTIYAYSITRSAGGDYNVTDTETINLVKNIQNHDDDGTPNNSVASRQVTGILVVGTADFPILYVSSSDPRIGGGGGGTGDVNLDTNSGMVSRLSWDGTQWIKVDIIRGLPRSEENHANNGLSLDASTNTLYVAVGGLTNAGSPSNNFAFISEYAYSACIIRVDLDAIEALPIQTDSTSSYVYDLPTVDDPTRANVNGINDPAAPGYVGDIGDPFGGNDGLNQAKLTLNSPVQIFSSGYRNAYDIAITETGQIYTWDNGANEGWGGHPDNEGGENATNRWISGEPGSNSDTANDAAVNNEDGLHLIGSLTDANRTYYGGHPNPSRANPSGSGLFTNDGSSGESGVFRQSVTSDPATSLPIDWPPVPPSLADAREGDFQNAGVDDGSLYTVYASTNGLVEYRSLSFDGALKGDLLAASFNGNIYRVNLNASGTIDSPEDVTVFASGFGSIPLDITAQADNEIFPGTIWAATYGDDSIVIFEPAAPVVCTDIYSTLLDDDNDGFSNADEIDNGSDPCNNIDRPFDADGDFISDLNDPDDDNDNIPDTLDIFPLDPENGLTTFIPIDYELLNGEPGYGFYGLGFTGVMHDLSTDYLDLVADEGNSSTEIIAGGAVGLLTFNGSPAGTALGATNSQKNAFQFGLNVMETTPSFTVATEILSPNITDNAASIGLFIGKGNQDDYLSIAVTQTGLKIVTETAGAASTQTFDIANISSIAELKLQLGVDPQSGTIQPSVSLEGGTLDTLGSPIPASGLLLDSLRNVSPLAVGVIASNPNGNANFNATWDSVKISYDDGIGCDGVWSSLTTPSGSFNVRHEADYVRVGDKFYLVGGRGGVDFAIYDPATGQWSQGAQPPIQIHHFQALAFQGELWVAGAFVGGYPGETPVDTALIYNPDTDTWRNGPVIPRPRGGGGLVAHNDKIYLVCGITNGHLSGHVAWLDCYDPATGEWTTLPDAPRARDHFRAVVIGDKIWNTAGRRTASGSAEGVFGNTVAEVDYYDISVGQWFTLPAGSNIPTPRAGNAAINYKDKVLVIGGESPAQNAAHSEVELLDPATENWTALPPLLDGRHGTGVIEYNGDLYIASGSGAQGGGPELSTHEKYCACVGDSFEPTVQVDTGTTWTPVISGNTGTLRVPLTNTSGSDVSIGSIMTDSPFFQIVQPAPTFIAAGSTVTIQITFDPGAGGNEAFSSKLTVITNSPTSPVIVVELSGERYSESTGEVVLALNAGGPVYTAADGTSYEADNGATGGGTYSTTDAIAGTADDTLYQSERNGSFSYAKPVINGNYELTLRFAELYFTDPNKRVFSVAAEGSTIISGLDLVATVGHDAAYDITLPVTVSDGTFNLELISSVNSAKLSAFVLTMPVATNPTSLVQLGTVAPVTVAPGSQTTLQVSINNPSARDVTITDLANSDATFSTVTTTPLVIAAGTSTNLDVLFTPGTGEDASFNNTLTITSDATETPTLTVSLAGTRAVPILTSLVQLGTVAPVTVTPGGQTTLQVIIDNPSAGDVTITDLTNSDATFSAVTTTPLVIAAGTSANLDVLFTPGTGEDASFNNTLTITSDATETPTLTVSLTGNRSVPAPTVQVEAGTTWTSVTSGDTGTLSVPLTNTSGFDLPIESIMTDSPFFQIVQPAPTFIAAGSTVTIQIAFDPGAGGSETFSSKLTVITNPPTSPVIVVELSGERSAESTREVVLALNAGGPAYTAANGTSYEADNGATGGGTYSNSSTIAGTADDTLYQSERNGSFSYAKPVANGNYELTLRFAELYFTAPNKRVFSVSAEGSTIISGLDLVATVGHDAAYNITLPVTVSDGTFNLELISSVNNAKLSAFVLTLPVAANPTSLVQLGTVAPVTVASGSQSTLQVSINNPSARDVTITDLANSDATFSAATTTPLVIAAGTSVRILMFSSPPEPVRMPASITPSPSPVMPRKHPR